MVEAPVPDVDHDPDIEGLDERRVLHNVAIGIPIGMLVMVAVTWALTAVAEPGHAAGLLPAALLAGVVGGGFFGAVVGLGLELSREEALHRAHRTIHT